MKKWIINSIFTLLTIFAFFIDREIIYQGNYLVIPLHISVLIATIFAIFILFFYNYVTKYKPLFSEKIIALLFSFFMVLGYSYLKTNSIDLVAGNVILIIVSILSLGGYFCFFSKLLAFIRTKILNLVSKNKKDTNETKKLPKIINYIFNEKPFLGALIFILLFWLIYIIAFYPIILSPDPSFQIKQFFNVHTKYADWVNLLDKNVFMTTHHPVIHTLLLGNSIKLGRLLGSDNLGLFIYSIIQVIVLASTLAYTLKYLKKINVNIKYRMIVLAIYALVPMFPFYAMSGVKDTIFTSLIILYVIFLFDTIKFYHNQKLSFKKIISLILLLLLIALFRNNGLYVIILSLPFLIIYNRKNWHILLSAFLIFLSLLTINNKIILPYFKISSGSVREALSIPFQQTARYIKYHEEDLSNKDKKLIDKILDYENIKNNYNPTFADPVKNNYNKETTDEELKEYFKLWVNGLVKHPLTYIDATINNAYGYFYPESHNWYLYGKFDSRITEDNLVDYSYNNLNGLRNILIGYGNMFPYIPIIGLISNIGFSTWIILALSIYVIANKKKQYLIILSPLLASILICVASPVNTYFRYAMPFIFAMPLLIGLFITILKEEMRKKNEK